MQVDMHFIYPQRNINELNPQKNIILPPCFGVLVIAMCKHTAWDAKIWIEGNFFLKTPKQRCGIMSPLIVKGSFKIRFSFLRPWLSCFSSLRPWLSCFSCHRPWLSCFSCLMPWLSCFSCLRPWLSCFSFLRPWFSCFSCLRPWLSCFSCLRPWLFLLPQALVISPPSGLSYFSCLKP